MYMGQGQDANMRLPWKERFIDYWVYLSDIGCFSAPTDGLVMQIMGKTPLAEYLRKGLEILHQEPQKEDGEEEEEYR